MVRFPNAVIFTNIKMNYEAPNLYFFKDYIRTGEKDKKGKPIWKYGLLDLLDYFYLVKESQEYAQLKRAHRPRFFIVIDEAAIIFNKYERSKLPPDFDQHIRQIRKYNGYLFFVSQNFLWLSIQFRNHIDWCFYFRPFLDSNFFAERFWEIRASKRKEDWTVKTYQYVAKDDQGNDVIKEKPIDKNVDRIYKPSRWKTYDDLYLNMKFDDVKVIGEYGPIKQYVDNYINSVVATYKGQRKLPSASEEKQLVLIWAEGGQSQTAKTNETSFTNHNINVLEYLRRGQTADESDISVNQRPL